MFSTITVSQLNNYVKAIIETDGMLRNVFVVGEISNFVNHYKSGHFYLSSVDIPYKKPACIFYYFIIKYTCFQSMHSKAFIKKK